ncbi:histidine phosphatase family protein [Novacetimonas maltaceti]|uniref:Histidine phosphatase superfamily n=1 Tax=Novacetimonas maltaceti TaxID=1203393 RepID=A0A2S3W0N5_9PROT|nr:histidine phosphatase family protein [Novacetimonas maltaceti]POF62431.1 Histidine phosphatase superfamily [Novacetimonas maltaceti]PYD60671.1 histidine phosphatase family protein [Novacetimonas maltaceti]
MTDLLARPYWYLRHGETDWNAEGRSQGRTDIPLNARGVEQARQAGLVLSRHLGAHPIARIVSSPLGRARRTAEIVAEVLAQHGAPRFEVQIDDGLKEVCFGSEEGKPMGTWYDSWIAGQYTPTDGESFAELRERAVSAINRATEAPGVPLVVCHGGMFRALRAAMGLKPNVRLPNATPMWAQPAGEGKPWELTAFS